MIKIKAKKLSSWLEKSEGLLGAKKPSPIFFKTHFGIHTFFMKFPIDVVILDSKGRVVTMKESLSPNQLFFFNSIHNGVLELPQGVVKKMKIKKNSVIQITS